MSAKAVRYDNEQGGLELAADLEWEPSIADVFSGTNATLCIRVPGYTVRMSYRAARKLAEALDFLGCCPKKGDGV